MKQFNRELRLRHLYGMTLHNNQLVFNLHTVQFNQLL
jgi:hypothetical protein